MKTSSGVTQHILSLDDADKHVYTSPEIDFSRL